MAAVSSSSSSTHLLYRAKPPPTPIFLSFFCRPFFPTATVAAAATTTTTILSKCHQTPHRTSLFTSPTFSSSFVLFCHSLSTTTASSSLISPQTPSPTDSSNEYVSSLKEGEGEEEEEEEEERDSNDDDDDEIEEFGDNVNGKIRNFNLKETVESEVGGVKSAVKLPSLTVKEKKELASYANGLGKKLKSQLVGKSGVTDNVATSFIETLEANELLKIKIHRTCPGELEDVVKRLEEATGSVVVGQIGRTVIIYRPSLTKLKAEEKRRQVRRVFVRKGLKFKPSLPDRQVPRLSGRGRRGTSKI